ncbi:MAG TPA: hypothetical protein VL172_15735 [Kofleriaceae bacterium]|nr:hypothetical protein [Kofleriaceae bacterium]
MNQPIADRVNVLRDEVLETAERGDADPPGAEVFDAIVRALVIQGETEPGLDHTLHDAISRRLAWGDREDTLLADADAVCSRLLVAAQRSFPDAAEEMTVVETAAEVVSAVARMVAMTAVARAGRERAARMREELGHKRLRDAIEKQKAELKRIEKQKSTSDF